MTIAPSAFSAAVRGIYAQADPLLPGLCLLAPWRVLSTIGAGHLVPELSPEILRDLMRRHRAGASLRELVEAELLARGWALTGEDCAPQRQGQIGYVRRETEGVAISSAGRFLFAGPRGVGLLARADRVWSHAELALL
ncbi:MAG: hypothetical protein AAF415_02260 [Pseudomonadota bacterium]